MAILTANFGNAFLGGVPRNSGIDVGTSLSLLSVALTAIAAVTLTTSVILLYVYDKNNGVLEYFLSLGMNQGDIYKRYLKAGVILVSLLMIAVAVANVAVPVRSVRFAPSFVSLACRPAFPSSMSTSRAPAGHFVLRIDSERRPHRPSRGIGHCRRIVRLPRLFRYDGYDDVQLIAKAESGGKSAVRPRLGRVVGGARVLNPVDVAFYRSSCGGSRRSRRYRRSVDRAVCLFK